MDARQAKRLKVGDKVTWGGDVNDAGTVTEVGYRAVKIQWDNGQLGVIHHNDMQDVTPAR